eukprot:762411-Hanusia_phi.AAC.2
MTTESTHLDRSSPIGSRTRFFVMYVRYPCNKVLAHSDTATLVYVTQIFSSTSKCIYSHGPESACKVPLVAKNNQQNGMKRQYKGKLVASPRFVPLWREMTDGESDFFMFFVFMIRFRGDSSLCKGQGKCQVVIESEESNAFMS